MPRRRTARRLAVDILYQADVTGRLPSAVLHEREALGTKVALFTREVVEGVERHLGEIDRLLGVYAEGWTVPRMAVVDRTLLRLAAYELLFRDDVPVAVAVNEAVEAAKQLSTEDSGRFVNGILGKLARERAEAGTA